MKVLASMLWLLTTLAWAHQSTTTTSGSPIYWTHREIPLVIVPDSTKVSAGSARSIIRSSLGEWNASSDTKIVEVGSSVNQIKFTKDYSVTGPAVLGLTELTYNTAGVIQKATILINDNFNFSTFPGFNYLGDVITHELGHMLGLAHSEVLNSTMFYAAFPGQRTLSSDDQAGIRAKYGVKSGSIRGSVKGGGNVGIYGAHVQAISVRDGQIVSTITKEDGSFNLTGLKLEDTYYLYTSPLRKLDALAPHLAHVQNNFCPGDYVGSFFSACGKEHEGNPQPVSLTAQRPTASVGTVTVNCSLKANADYAYEKLHQRAGEVLAFDYWEERRNGKAFVGYFQAALDDEWQGPDRLIVDLEDFPTSNYPRSLKLQLISQALGSRLEFELTVLRETTGQVLLQQGRVVTADNTFNLDLSGFLPLSSVAGENRFLVEVRARRLDALDSDYLINTMRSFPSYGSFSSDKYLPYLLAMSVWEDAPGGQVPQLDVQESFVGNEACLDGPFSYAVGRARATASDLPLDDNDQSVTAACGTISPPDDRGGTGMTALAMGFMFVLVFSRLMKRTKNFLS